MTEEVKCFSKFNLLRNEDITPDKVKGVYNKIIFLAHPDRGGTIEETQSINMAKKILLDPRSRKGYIKVSSQEI